MDFVIIMTMIGIISLAGVVVNNAIVLLDYINIVVERYKVEHDISEGSNLPFSLVVQAIIHGGKTRLRPVLLTAITTVLGLLPLAIGINIDFVGLITPFDPHFYIGGDNNVLETAELGNHLRINFCNISNPYSGSRHVLVDGEDDLQTQKNRLICSPDDFFSSTKQPF
jgi:hypothetical protein